MLFQKTKHFILLVFKNSSSSGASGKFWNHRTQPNSSKMDYSVISKPSSKNCIFVLTIPEMALWSHSFIEHSFIIILDQIIWFFLYLHWSYDKNIAIYTLQSNLICIIWFPPQQASEGGIALQIYAWSNGILKTVSTFTWKRLQGQT